MIIMCKSSDLLNFSCFFFFKQKTAYEISTLLHGNNSELIFFVDPDKEGFIVIVENTTTLWPISIQVACLKESVSFLEQEMVIDKLLLLCSSHRSEGVESASELSLE